MARRLNISLEKDCGCDKPNAATYNQGNGEDQVFMMTGPMGDMYTKALAVRFAKEPLGEESTSTADPEVATEGFVGDFMSSIKSMFSSKKKIEEATKEDKEAEKAKWAAEYKNFYGKVRKVLNELTSKPFVQDNCDIHQSDDNAKELIKALNAARSAQKQLSGVFDRLDKVTQANVDLAGKDQNRDDTSFTEMGPVLDRELNKLPSDFGFGIKLKVVPDAVGEYKGFDGFSALWTDYKAAQVILGNIKHIKLSPNDITIVAKLVRDIEDAEDESPWWFPYEREGKEVDLDGKYYFDSYSASDIFNRVGDDSFGICTLSEHIVDAALFCLNNHIRDDMVSVESQSQDSMLASAVIAQAHIEKQKDNLRNIQIVGQTATLTATPQVIAYVVHAKDSMNPDTVVKINDWVEKAKASKRNVIMICDTNKPMSNWMGTNANVIDEGKILSSFELGQGFSRATESYYEKMGVPVIFGMEAFVDYVGNNYGGQGYQSIATEGFLEYIKRIYTGNRHKKHGGSDEKIKQWLKTQFTNNSWLDKQEFGEGSQENKDYINDLDKLENVMKWLTEFANEVEKANDINIKIAEKYQSGEELTNSPDVKRLVNLTNIWNKFTAKTPIEYQSGIKLKYDRLDMEFEDAESKQIPATKLSKEEAKLLGDKLLKILEKLYYTNPGFGSEGSDVLRNTNVDYVVELTYYAIEEAFENCNIGQGAIDNILYGYFKWLDNSVLGIAKKRGDGDHEYR